MVVVNKLSQRQTGVTYRTPHDVVNKRDQEVQGPKAVSTVGGGRGGCLISFAQAIGGSGAR